MTERARGIDDARCVHFGAVAQIEVPIVQMYVAVAEAAGFDVDDHLIAGRRGCRTLHFDEGLGKLLEAIAEHGILRWGLNEQVAVGWITRREA